MAINAKWHKANPMPKKSTDNQKIQWHVDHARECACRPIPKSILAKMKERKPKLVVSVLTKNNGKYLLAREMLESGIDKWIVPGGKVEFGESLEDAALREIKEETGLNIDNLEFLCFKEALFPKYNYHTVIFFFSATSNKFDLEDDIEGKVIESKWFTKSQVKKLPLVESAKWLFEWLENGKNNSS